MDETAVKPSLPPESLGFTDADLLRMFSNNAGAVAFIRDTHNIIRLVDDVVDDELENPDGFAEILRYSFGSLPYNEFFNAFRSELLPLMNAVVNSWQTTIRIEKDYIQGKTGAERLLFAHTRRYDFYLLLMHCVLLTGGYKKYDQFALEAWDKLTFKESFNDYSKEQQELREQYAKVK